MSFAQLVCSAPEEFNLVSQEGGLLEFEAFYSLYHLLLQFLHEFLYFLARDW
ncbi:uncharacterized protein METZ01_LOCUS447761, partial [marine metagenome]